MDDSKTATYREVSDYESMLECLEGERIVDFQWNDSEVVITESCDNYFSCTFTYEQMKKLIAELQEKVANR